MKKIISLILTLILVFLIGCSAEIPLINEPEPVGFVEMNIDEDYIKSAYSICSKDNLIVFMTVIFRDKDGNILNPQCEEDYDDANETSYIVEYDAKKNKLIDIFEIKECPIKEVWGIELEDDKIVIYSDSEKKNAYYDLDMNFLEEAKRNVVDEFEIASKSKFHTDMSGAYDGYCYFNGNNNNQYLYFYENPDEIYIFKSDKAYQPSYLNKENHYILSEAFDNSCNAVSFKVIDFLNAKKINEASISASKYGFNYTTTNCSGFGNKYAVCLEYLADETDENSMHKMFYWNYLNETTNEALDIEKYTELESVNKQCIAEIKNEYGVDIHVNEECENISGNVDFDETISPLILYDDISVIKSFLDSLPQGMIEETYSRFYDKEFESTGIRIDIVSKITMQNDITNDVAAFAQRWSEPMELCFSYRSVNSPTVAHEFMHLFDQRIDDYLNHQGTTLYDKWNKFNAKYEHKYNEKDEFHRQYEFDGDNFITEYASSNDDEDRAVIFENLYSNHSEETRPWLESEGIKTKVDCLNQLLREAFPSVNAVQTAYWEQ